MRELRVMVHPGFRSHGTNPYQWLLYEALGNEGVEVVPFSRRDIRAGRCDLVHVHWPEYYAGGSGMLGALRRMAGVASDAVSLRRHRIGFVWTVHNLQPHEFRGRPIDRLYWRWFPCAVDGSLHLGDAARQVAFERYPALRHKPSMVSRHGRYPDPEANAVDRSEARRRLELPADRILVVHVGAIRPYKRVPEIVMRFSEETSPAADLVIAGEPWYEDGEGALDRIASGSNFVHLRLGFVPDDEWGLYIRAADVVLLPQRDMFNSGAALAALSRDRPVVLTDTPTTRELQRLVGAEWVVLCDDIPGAKELANLVQEGAVARSGSPNMKHFEWAGIAKATRELYDQAIVHAKYRRLCRSRAT